MREVLPNLLRVWKIIVSRGEEAHENENEKIKKNKKKEKKNLKNEIFLL